MARVPDLSVPASLDVLREAAVMHVRMWLRCGLTLVTAVALAGCTATAPASAPPRTGSSSTTAHRVDVAVLGQQLDAFFANDAADAFRNRQALLVSVDGHIVLERYWHSTATTSGNIESVGKTIMSTLIGVALGEGRLRSLDQTVGPLLPAYSKVMSHQVAAITLRQLLTMTSGLATDDEFYPTVFTTRRQDWVRQILSRGQTGPPGTFQYSSAGSHLLSAILSQVTGRSVLDYARDKLFDPLGINTRPATSLVAVPEKLDAYQKAAGFAWPTDPQGRYIGGGGQKLTARDMAVLGQLWLQGGRWGNRQLVPSAWLTGGGDGVPTGYSSPWPPAYGYQVWLGASAGHDALVAHGFAGQFIEVVPDLGLVVAVLSRHNPDPRAPEEPGTADLAYLGLVSDVIAPTVH